MRLALALVLLCPVTLAAQTYQMPVPGFGLTEQPGAPVCYVNNADPDATDTANPCGTEAIPRLTVPTTTLLSGAVIQVTGGAGTAGCVTPPCGTVYSLGSNVTWTSSAILATPAFIVGVGGPSFLGNGIGRTVTVAGTYLIVQGIDFIGIRVDVTGTAIGLRNIEVYANTSVGGVAVFGAGLVLSGSSIHNIGPTSDPDENDFHCVYVADTATFTWVLTNQLYRCSGDGVQVGNQSTGPSGTFIGGNTMYLNGENAVDVKAATDTIVSQNLMWGYQVTSHSEGAAVVIHDNPVQVWVINNYIAYSVYGISVTEGDGVLAIGNIMVGALSGAPVPGLDGPGAIVVRNTSNTGMYYNTAYIWDSAFALSSGNGGSNAMVGNIAYANPYTVRQTSGSPTISNNLEYPTNPLFEDPSVGNFRLLVGSPAIGAGTTAPAAFASYQTLYGVALANDIYGNPWAGTFNIGAAQGPGQGTPRGPIRLRFRSTS